MVLSVAAAVSVSISTNTPIRLTWLEVALSAVDVSNQSPDITQYAPRLMDVLTERLTDEYMRLNSMAGGGERAVMEPLARIFALVRQAKGLKNAITGSV